MPVRIARSIRQRLRLIRYYSASRPSSGWDRARDLVLAAALFLAWPVTWALDRAHVAASARDRLVGQLYEGPGDRTWAWMPPPPRPPDEAVRESAFFGAFQVTVVSEDRGFPFVTSRGTRQAGLNVELFEEGRSLAAADLAAGSPVRQAIERVLVRRGRGDAAVALWGAPGEARVRRPAAWVANGITWSLGLAAVVWLGVTVLRVTMLPVELRRRALAARRRRGDRCVHCGYDLRGNAFAERCPECGALV